MMDNIEDLDPVLAREILEQTLDHDRHSLAIRVVSREISELARSGAPGEISDHYSQQAQADTLEIEFLKRRIAAAQTKLDTL
jgi:hypothetical protein